MPPARRGDVALIIDDDDMIRGLLAAIMVKEGFETHAAPDGGPGSLSSRNTGTTSASS